MNQNLFEMYIGVTINFQKEPDYGHQIPHYKVFSRICFSNAATGAAPKTISTSTILTKKTTEAHPAPAMMTTTVIRPKRMR